MPEVSPDADLDISNLAPNEMALLRAARIALAAEALAARLDDLAIDSYRPRPAGRPSLTGSATASPRVSFRLTPELRDEATRLALSEGTTVSQLARNALEARLKAHPINPRVRGVELARFLGASVSES